MNLNINKRTVLKCEETKGVCRFREVPFLWTFAVKEWEEAIERGTCGGRQQATYCPRVVVNVREFLVEVLEDRIQTFIRQKRWFAVSFCEHLKMKRHKMTLDYVWRVLITYCAWLAIHMWKTPQQVSINWFISFIS